MVARLEFRNALLAVANCRADATEIELAALNRRFREAFLNFGSETPDNKSCIKSLKVGLIDDGTSAHRPTVGLRVTGRNWALSTVLNAAEGCPIPAQLSADFPALTQDQWDAVMRMATMMALTLQGAPLPDDE